MTLIPGEIFPELVLGGETGWMNYGAVEIRDYLNGGIKERLAEYVTELYKELYIYSTKSHRTVEDIYNDLDRMMKEF